MRLGKLMILFIATVIGVTFLLPQSHANAANESKGFQTDCDWETEYWGDDRQPGWWECLKKTPTPDPSPTTSGHPVKPTSTIPPIPTQVTVTSQPPTPVCDGVIVNNYCVPATATTVPTVQATSTFPPIPTQGTMNPTSTNVPPTSVVISPTAPVLVCDEGKILVVDECVEQTPEPTPVDPPTAVPDCGQKCPPPVKLICTTFFLADVFSVKHNGQEVQGWNSIFNAQTGETSIYLPDGHLNNSLLEVTLLSTEVLYVQMEDRIWDRIYDKEDPTKLLWWQTNCRRHGHKDDVPQGGNPISSGVGPIDQPCPPAKGKQE